MACLKCVRYYSSSCFTHSHSFDSPYKADNITLIIQIKHWCLLKSNSLGNHTSLTLAVCLNDFVLLSCWNQLTLKYSKPKHRLNKTQTGKLSVINDDSTCFNLVISERTFKNNSNYVTWHTSTCRAHHKVLDGHPFMWLCSKVKQLLVAGFPEHPSLTSHPGTVGRRALRTTGQTEYSLVTKQLESFTSHNDSYFKKLTGNTC